MIKKIYNYLQYSKSLMKLFVYKNVKNYLMISKGINLNSTTLNKHGFISWKNYDFYQFVLEDFRNFEKKKGNKINFLPILNCQNASAHFKFFTIPFDNYLILTKIFSEELFELLKEFFGKNFYVRGNIQLAIIDGETSIGTENFHIDGEYTVNLMINLTECTSKSVHMEFIDAQFDVNPSDEKSVRSAKKHYTFGKAGDSFLFTAGRNYHRRMQGEKRAVLLISFVPTRPRNMLFEDKNIEKRNELNLFYAQDNPAFKLFIDNSSKWTRNQFRLYQN